MRICLLRPLPDPQRWSMDLYSRQLLSLFKSSLKPGEEVQIFPGEEDFGRWWIPAGPLAKPLRYWQQYGLYGLRAHQLKADVYHITDHGYLNLMPFLGPGRKIVSCHDMLLNNLNAGTLPVNWKPRASIFLHSRFQRLLNKADRIITGSEFTRSEITRWAGIKPGRITVIPDGVSAEFGKAQSSTRLNVFRKQWRLDGRKVILVPGRTDAHKNIEGTLAVIAQLIRQGVPAVMLKTGSPLTAAQLSLADQLGISEHVISTGHLNIDDLIAAYQVSDALLFLSWYEGFGLPAAEAMAAGIPAVISGHGSLPETAGGAARIVDPAKPEEAAAALRQVLTDVKLRVELIDKGKRRAAQLTWEKTASRTLEVYREVMEGHS